MSQNDFDDNDFYWEKYRWEFMRRNRKYRETYDDLMKFYNDDTIPEINRVYKYMSYLYKWGLYPRCSRFPNPYNSFEEEFKPEEVPKYFDRSYISVIRDNRLGISINLEEVNSVHDIKKRMLEDFEMALKMMKEDGKKPKARKRIDYDVILVVGDLREEGLTYEQIAKKVFPRDFNINNENAKPESAIRKIGQYYQKYRDLVTDGYKDVTFP